VVCGAQSKNPVERPEIIRKFPFPGTYRLARYELVRLRLPPPRRPGRTPLTMTVRAETFDGSIALDLRHPKSSTGVPLVSEPDKVPGNAETDGLLRSHFLEVDGMRWHYRAGPRRDDPLPIILIPGLVISSRYMVPLAERLSARHSVFALDLPGFGRSAAQSNPMDMKEFATAVERWMQTAGIPRGHLVANSMGCQIVAHLAARWPARVGTVTFIGATIDPARHRFATQFVALLRDACHEPATLWQIWISDFFRAGIFRSVATARAMFADHIEEQLPKIHAPVLVIRGGADPTMPVRWAKEAADRVPRGRLVEIKGDPHFVH
jgi:pimeloyl-ACP methyl ester carboxylesterase